MVVVVVVVVLVTLYVLPGRPPASAGNVQLLWRFDFRLCIRGQAALARAGIIVKADANPYPRMLLVCYVIADIVVLYQTILYSYTTVVTIIVPPHCLLHHLIFFYSLHHCCHC